MEIGDVEYRYVKHDDNLYRVYSYTCNKGMFGTPQLFTNFVAETKSQEEAKSIIQRLQNGD